MRYREIICENSEWIEEVLYHGTQVEFDAFDHTKTRTAKHLYTSPDIHTALFYGDIIYECRVRGPQADITSEAHANGDSTILDEIAEEYADRFKDQIAHGLPEWSDHHAAFFAVKAKVIERLKAQNTDPDYDDRDAEWDAEEDPEYKEALHAACVEEAIDVIVGGKTYEREGRHFQDAILDEVFAKGYRSVRFTDPSSEGAPISVVAYDASDIKIIRRVRRDLEERVEQESDYQYMHIGHNAQSELWYRNKEGAFEIHEPDYEGQTHGSFRSEKIGRSYGRVDHQNQMISMAFEPHGRPVSDAEINATVKMLRRRYPDYRIFNFLGYPKEVL